MANFALRRESIEEIFDYNILITKFENQAEQRRLKSSGKLIGFKITTPALTKTQMQEYRDFFVARSGAYEAFTFTSPFDDVTYNVRFELNSFQNSYKEGAYRCSFNFKILSEV